MATYRSILIVNLGGIGDLMLSSPALRAIRAAFPPARICLLAARRCVEYGCMLDQVDEVRSLSLGQDFVSRGKDLVELLRLRMAGFALAVNMRTIVSRESRARIKFIFDVIRPAASCGRDTAGRGDFFTIRIPENEGDERYEMEYDLATASALTGAAVSDRKIDFPVSGTGRDRVKRLFSGAGIRAEDRVIGFHVGGKQSHLWPLSAFAETASNLSSMPGCKFVVTGGEEDIIRGRQLVSAADIPMVDLCGRLSLDELGAAIARCAVFVTPDTAAMHIAAVLKVPLVAIFGPGYLKRFDPRVISPDAVVMRAATDCAPCNRPRCDSLKCLSVITPEQVTEAVSGLLRKGAGG